MGGPSSGAARRGHSLAGHAVISVVINATLSAGISYWLGTLLADGFEWSWYTHPGETLDEDFLFGDIAVAGLLTAFVVSLIVTYITYALHDRGGFRGPPADRWVAGTTRTRGGHAFRKAVMFALAAGVVGALNVAAYHGLTDVEVASRDTFVQGRAAWAALVAAAVAFASAMSAGAGLRAKRIVHADPAEGNVIARLSNLSARNAKVTLLLVAVITAGLGSGLEDIHTNVDVADVMPRGDPNTRAAHNVTERFKSTFTQQVTIQFFKDEAACQKDSARNLPFRRTAVNCANITDEVYVRAMEEFFVFMQREVPIIKYNVGVNSFYKLINWTLAGGYEGGASNETFSLPDTSPDGEAQYDAVQAAVWRAIPGTVQAVLDPSVEQTAQLYLVDSKETHESKEIGEAVVAAWEKWKATDAEHRWTVFTGDNEPQFTVDLPVANAHSSELTEEDLKTLMPLILYFIILCLYVAFRDIKSVVIAIASLTVAIVWTYGLMGHADIALNTLNLTIVPLLLGTGIDYSIHMMNEYLEHKSHGLTDAEAFRVAGDRAGSAMLIATLTTVIGLIVLTISPSALIAELGLLSAFGIASVYLLAITFMPALITITGGPGGKGAQFSRSAIMPGLARIAYKARPLVWLLVIGATAVTFVTLQGLEKEQFGDPGRNYPPEDEYRQMHEATLTGFYDSEEKLFKANVLVFQGDILAPETDAYLRRLNKAVQIRAAESGYINPQSLRDLPFLTETWLTVRGGGPGVVEDVVRKGLAGRGVAQASEYPQTREDFQREMDHVFDTPLATFASLFIDYPTNNMTITVFAVQEGSYDIVKSSWDAVHLAIEDVEAYRPDDVQVTFFGNTAINYLFIEEELPWLMYVSIVASIAVVLLVAIGTRNLKATVAVGLIMYLTSQWWLGVLPSLGVGLAITLSLPLVFILAIGSDYAVHTIWNIRKVGDASEVFATTGKAIFFSFITTVGAFILFIPTQNVAVSKSMVATAVAFCIIFVVTILVVPLFYPFHKEEERAPVRTATVVAE